ncbi:MAG: hypothetical protein QOE16_1289 [Microbacteriaceae bacterium]|nr:hypothetical protein [Microbacteriaceae bacterium]
MTTESAISIRGREEWLSPASYWMPTHFTITAWMEHAPFASWIVDALQPRSIVELGTHWGYSYFAFCEAVKRLGLDTRTYALDTWAGEEHAGVYGEEVFDYVSAVNRTEYADFSTLIRGYFDDSLDKIEDGSVDLLHIDGRHRLPDVTHDFESWVPKLSSRAVVLFHDIAEHQEDFGVWEFWEGVSQRYRSFAFEHNHGLGVLGVGADLPGAMERFFDAAESSPEAVRATYERLGGAVSELASVYSRPAELQHELNQLRAEIDREARVPGLDARIVDLQNQLDAVHSSTSWKVTQPIRTFVSRIRSGR